MPAYGAHSPVHPSSLCFSLGPSQAYGVHVNGFQHNGPGEQPDSKGSSTFLWVAKRSASKPTYPGKLDNMVAGGQVRGPRAVGQVT